MREKLYFQWHITDACNFRCRHCYQEDFSAESELDLTGLITIHKNITSRARDSKTVINLTGGEPLLRRDFFDLLFYLDGHKTTEEILVITNASLIDEDAIGKFKRAGKLKRLKISLDGGKEETNDSIRGKGSFKRVLDKISFIKRNSCLEVIIMLTVMKSNSHELPSLARLCGDLGLDGLIIERFVPLGQSRSLKAEVIAADDWARIVRESFELADSRPEEKDFVIHKAFWLQFEDGRRQLMGAECNLGEDNFAIMPDGSLLPCRRLALPIGNLLRENFSDIVSNSRIMKDIADKKKLKGRCGVCDIGSCRGCRALAYALTGDYLAEDNLCFKSRL